MTTKEAIAKVHALYCRAYETCRRADGKDKRRVALQATKNGGFRMTIASVNYGGTTCYRFPNMQIPDWASNVVYRLVEECLVPDLSSDDIDTYFDRLNAVGYDVEI